MSFKDSLYFFFRFFYMFLPLFLQGQTKSTYKPTKIAAIMKTQQNKDYKQHHKLFKPSRIPRSVASLFLADSG